MPSCWIEKHGSTHRVRMRDKRKKLTVQSGLTLRKAISLKKKTITNIAIGRNVIPARVTYEQLFEKIDTIFRQQISPEYYTLLIRSMKKLSEYTGCKLSNISTENIDLMTADMLDCGLSDSTINKYIRHCSAACKKAVDWGMMIINPFNDINMRIVPDRDIKIITESDEQKILSACRTQRDRCIIYLALNGGMRAKEIANLKIKQEYNYETGQVKIINHGAVTTKTRRQRSVFIFDQERKDELNQLAYSRKGYGQYPFYNMNPRCVSQRMIQIRDRAGVDCTLHDLRRTCATRMLLSGVPVPVVAKWMGHTIRVMQDFYVNISTDNLMMVRDKLYPDDKTDQKLCENAINTDSYNIINSEY